MNVIELEDGTVVTQIDAQFLEVNEIQDILGRVQSEIFKLVTEKKNLTSLPKCRKTQKTFKRVSKISCRLLELQSAQAWLGNIKKQKRDSMAKERTWYKEWFRQTYPLLKSKVSNRLCEEINEKINYTIDPKKVIV